MKSLWEDKKALSLKGDPLKLRVYTSRLIGQEQNLVLHGGGNTSVKDFSKNLFGEREEVLYVKGSGWDLATIEEEGFAPVRLEALQKMARLKKLSDSKMVEAQRAAMTNPYAPNPSVEAILHAIIPFKFVDHTHADAVVTVTNTPGGEDRVREIYGKRVMVIPYVMPGFILARAIFEQTKEINWSDLEGMILMNHGIFTFSDDAKTSYQKMIKLVTKAERYIAAQIKRPSYPDIQRKEDLLKLARTRKAVSNETGSPVLARLDQDKAALHFADFPNVASVATRGPLTPDHVIRTKRIPVIIKQNGEEDVKDYAHAYREYFDRNDSGKLISLDKAPRWGVWPGHGTISFGKNTKEGSTPKAR